MIEPTLAGQFYEKDFGKLSKQIENSFNNERGPGELPCSRTKKRIFGIIVPESSYAFSAPAMAWAYKAIAERRFASTYIILTQSDKYEIPVTCTESWQTIFGQVKVDKTFVMELKNKNKIKEIPNLNDPKIEIQLPFLQFVNKDALNEIKIVPLIVPKDFDYKQLASDISDVSTNICVIVSSDFTCYGSFHNYLPFKFNIKESIYQIDGNAIEQIKKLNSETFLDMSKKTNIQSPMAIATMLEIMKNYFSKVNVMNYYTTGDILKDYNNSRSFASISFEE